MDISESEMHQLEVHQLKSQIRIEMRRRRSRLDEAYVSDASSHVVSRIKSLSVMRHFLSTARRSVASRSVAGQSTARRYARVAAYRKINNEIALDELTEGEGWEMFTFPRVKGVKLEFISRFEGQTFCRSQLSVPEPVEGDSVELFDHDVVIVPLIAFDTRCNRLGQGGGFYDRTLRALVRHPVVRHSVAQDLKVQDPDLMASHHEVNLLSGLVRHPVIVGVAYDFQQVEQVPVCSWDVQLDAVVTNTDVIINTDSASKLDSSAINTDVASKLKSPAS